METVVTLRRAATLLATAATCGCAALTPQSHTFEVGSARVDLAAERPGSESTAAPPDFKASNAFAATEGVQTPPVPPILQTSGTTETDDQTPLPLNSAEQTDPEATQSTDPASSTEATTNPLQLSQVLASIYASYPLLEAAYRERGIAFGNQVSSWGAFDTKLYGYSENQPLGFYETYRQQIGVDQPLFNGGNAYAAYRIGRGSFEPWYLERQTNDAGEFKAGLVVPLLQGRDIDPRRRDLWQAGLERQAVEPDIRGQLIEFTRAGAFAYWEWVAAGRTYQIARDLFELADRRTDALTRRSEEGDIEPIALADNERLVVSRGARFIEAERELRQAAVRLSLYYRDAIGRPIVPGPECLPKEITPPPEITPEDVDLFVERALAERPEMTTLAIQRRQIGVELDLARNDLLPAVGAGIEGSQDVGEATSPKRDKSEFELETGITLEVPIQRRRARGKILANEAKLAQLNAKTQFTRDKIETEVETAAIALVAALQQYEQAARSLELAQQLEEAEYRRFELGDSDLFTLNLREQQTAEAATLIIDSLLQANLAAAELRAALGELPPVEVAPPLPQGELVVPPAPAPLPEDE